MPTQKNIFEFADRFGYESPFGDWVTEEREKREEREAYKLKRERKENEWGNIYFAISIPKGDALNPSSNPINFVYSYNAQIKEELPKIAEQFKQLKDSFDYLNSSENEVAKAYMKWVKESKMNFMFRIGLHKGRPQANQSITAYNDDAPFKQAFYILTDCNPTMGEIVTKSEYPYQKFSQSGAVAKMAQEFGHNFEKLFQLGEDLQGDDTLKESQEVNFENVNIQRTIDVLPLVSIDINVISNGQIKKRNFKFMRNNEVLKPMKDESFFQKRLLKVSTQIGDLYNWGLIDLTEKNKLEAFYRNFEEYIGLFYQNCFARGLKEDEIPAYNITPNNKAYTSKEVEGKPTIAPKK